MWTTRAVVGHTCCLRTVRTVATPASPHPCPSLTWLGCLRSPMSVRAPRARCCRCTPRVLCAPCALRAPRTPCARRWSLRPRRVELVCNLQVIVAQPLARIRTFSMRATAVANDCGWGPTQVTEHVRLCAPSNPAVRYLHYSATRVCYPSVERRMSGSPRMERAWPACMAFPLVVRSAWSAAPRHWHASALLDASSACPRPMLDRGVSSVLRLSCARVRARACTYGYCPVNHGIDSKYRSNQ